jgi:hypothetical protein
MRQPIRFSIILAYLWIMMILFGSIVMETFLIYPNVFYDPPRSLDAGLEFMQVRAPSDFFPPLGFLSWVTGTAAIAAGWRTRTARSWIAASVAMIVCEGFFSMLFFWPRNTIMFVEGSTVHSAEVLRQTAREFQSLHWGRVAFNAASAAFVFVGFLKFYRTNLITVAQQAAPAGPGPTVLILLSRATARRRRRR